MKSFLSFFFHYHLAKPDWSRKRKKKIINKFPRMHFLFWGFPVVNSWLLKSLVTWRRTKGQMVQRVLYQSRKLSWHRSVLVGNDDARTVGAIRRDLSRRQCQKLLRPLLDDKYGDWVLTINTRNQRRLFFLQLFNGLTRSQKNSPGECQRIIRNLIQLPVSQKLGSFAQKTYTHTHTD